MDRIFINCNGRLFASLLLFLLFASTNAVNPAPIVCDPSLPAQYVTVSPNTDQIYSSKNYALTTYPTGVCDVIFVPQNANTKLVLIFEYFRTANTGDRIDFMVNITHADGTVSYQSVSSLSDDNWTPGYAFPMSVNGPTADFNGLIATRFTATSGIMAPGFIAHVFGYDISQPFFCPTAAINLTSGTFGSLLLATAGFPYNSQGSASCDFQVAPADLITHLRVVVNFVDLHDGGYLTITSAGKTVNISSSSGNKPPQLVFSDVQQAVQFSHRVGTGSAATSAQLSFVVVVEAFLAHGAMSNCPSNGQTFDLYGPIGLNVMKPFYVQTQSDFTQFYENNLHCSWTATIPDASEYVIITYNELFQLETCCDKMTVVTGGSKVLELDGSNTELPSLTQLNFNFNSDQIYSQNGARIQMRAVPLFDKYQPANQINNLPGDSSELAIQSPGYSYAIPSRLDISYIFMAPAGMFCRFRLSNKYAVNAINQGCSVLVYNGPDWTHNIANITGQSQFSARIYNNVWSSGQYMTVRILGNGRSPIVDPMLMAGIEISLSAVTTRVEKYPSWLMYDQTSPPVLCDPMQPGQTVPIIPFSRLTYTSVNYPFSSYPLGLCDVTFYPVGGNTAIVVIMEYFRTATTADHLDFSGNLYNTSGSFPIADSLAGDFWSPDFTFPKVGPGSGITTSGTILTTFTATTGPAPGFKATVFGFDVRQPTVTACQSAVLNYAQSFLMPTAGFPYNAQGSVSCDWMLAPANAITHLRVVANYYNFPSGSYLTVSTADGQSVNLTSTNMGANIVAPGLIFDVQQNVTFNYRKAGGPSATADLPYILVADAYTVQAEVRNCPKTGQTFNLVGPIGIEVMIPFYMDTNSDFTQFYANNLHCTWSATITDPTQYVIVSYVDFYQLEMCCDHFMVKNTSDVNYQIMDLKSATDYPQATSLDFRFDSDHIYAQKGARVQLRSVPLFDKNHLAGSVIPLSADSSEYTVQSPGYGFAIPRFLDVAWTCQAPAGMWVRFRLSNMFAPLAINQETVLMVYDGSSTSAPLIANISYQAQTSSNNYVYANVWSSGVNMTVRLVSSVHYPIVDPSLLAGIEIQLAAVRDHVPKYPGFLPSTTIPPPPTTIITSSPAAPTTAPLQGSSPPPSPSPSAGSPPSAPPSSSASPTSAATPPPSQLPTTPGTAPSSPPASTIASSSSPSPSSSTQSGGSGGGATTVSASFALHSLTVIIVTVGICLYWSR